MAEVFRDHPTQADTRVWRRSSWGAIGSGIVLVLCVVLCVTMLAAGLAEVLKPGPLTIDGQFYAVAIGIALGVTVMAAIGQLVWRDMRGKMGARITLTDAGMELRLPAGRSLIHRPPRCRVTIPWSNVKCIETRQEVYGAQGMAMLNRVYRIRLQQGDPIFLFEQRGIRSNVETASMQDIADELASRAGGRVRELGKFEGRGGVLGAWFSKPPSWTEAPVSRTRWETMQRRVVFTAWIGAAALTITWLAHLLAAAL